MNQVLLPEKGPSPFKLELAKFRILFRRYLEHWLNEFFKLSLDAPYLRTRWVTIFYLVFVAINIAISLPPILSHLHHDLPALSGQPSAPIQYSNELLFFMAVIGYITIPFFVSAYYALEMASRYLADIFELSHVEIARTFIRQLSLRGGGSIVRIRAGKVVEEDQESPLIKIGGPGRVIVEFDSAVLFEKQDGTPHVIGPANLVEKTTEGELRDNTLLEGFERFREAVDLRDHYIGNPGGEPMTVSGLSLDGFPISATDVRAVYSIRRSESNKKTVPTRQLPYPYVRRSIEDLIYQMPVSVIPESPNPSELPQSWTNTVHALIRGAFGEFMNDNNLSEYLASFGAPEVELAESQEKTIQFQRFEITADRAGTTKPAEISQPEFHPRTELSGIFSQLSDRFTKRAHERGIDLHWIGVGTWRIPDKIAAEIVNGQHLQAWQINRDNAARGSQEVMDSVFKEACIKEKSKRIQSVPLGLSREIIKNKTKNGSRVLLEAYWELLGECTLIYYNAGDPLPKELEQGIRIIETYLFKDQHYVGGVPPTKLRKPAPEEKTPPAPETHNEARLYPQLLRLVDGDYKKAEWLIEYEGKKFTDQTREQIIQYLIDHPELCMF